VNTGDSNRRMPVKSAETMFRRLAWVTALAFSCSSCLEAGLIAMSSQIEGECYQDLSVTVIDDRTGGKVCDARVTLLNSDGETEVLEDCYQASLLEGRYRLRASMPGRKAATTFLEVPDLSACKPSTSTVMLTIPP